MAQVQSKDKLGSRIKSAREKRKMTQAELSKILGVDVAQLSRWENGKHYPAFETLKVIAKTLRTSIAYLLGEKS